MFLSLLLYFKWYIVLDDDCMIVDSGPAPKTVRGKTKIKRELRDDGLDYTKEELQAFLRMKKAAKSAVSKAHVEVS